MCIRDRIGYRGSGKSSVAPHLAKLLGKKCVDTDDQIELVTGNSIADIFAQQGEAGFRQWETTVIQAYALEHDLVVSLGGGAPTVKENRQLLQQSGKTALLVAEPEILWQRISSDPASKSNRPDLTDLDGFAEVKKVLQQRAATCLLYTSPSPRDQRGSRMPSSA